jgi:hypothetical protein
MLWHCQFSEGHHTSLQTPEDCPSSARCGHNDALEALAVLPRQRSGHRVKTGCRYSRQSILELFLSSTLQHMARWAGPQAAGLRPVVVRALLSHDLAYLNNTQPENWQIEIVPAAEKPKCEKFSPSSSRVSAGPSIWASIPVASGAIIFAHAKFDAVPAMPAAITIGDEFGRHERRAL